MEITKKMLEQALGSGKLQIIIDDKDLSPRTGEAEVKTFMDKLILSIKLK